MSSDEDEVVLFYNYIRRRRRRTRKQFWIYPYIETNVNRRLFIAAQELSEDEAKFQTFYRMRKQTLQELVEIVSPLIQRQNTDMRESVSAEERIMITLR
ncbi:hypothetical protein ILUMI_03313 [Ignelater luminosus]|uniref:Protein ANTAGONIST OF LIKE HETEROCHROMATIN PROTEIN 1-like n=1 Tax=Ignelater luminosus TaxID=2038154 RepID=A0A8K0DGI6_IGNLU|nr:hypothetical protein ILUMI_03313 [Ignelater luminosus]